MTKPDFYTRKLAEGRAVLAPMAGFTDAPFRKLCRRFGSGWAVTEMVSAKALVQGDGRGLGIGAPYKNEPDLVIQVFGGEPEIVAAGGRILYDTYRPAALDLNMGCPVKKVTGKSCGSQLMRDPERAAAIVRALAQAVPVPVSAKLRLGFDTVNVLEVALALEEAGAALLTIHGRTAAQKYSGEADWDTVAEVAAQLSVPVVGSGDVTTKAQFERYRALGSRTSGSRTSGSGTSGSGTVGSSTSGSSTLGLGVMVGRGALGQPWLFSTFRGEPEPSESQKLEVILEHAHLARSWYGREHAIVKLRGQLLRYAENLLGGAALRPALTRVSTLAELTALLSGLQLERLEAAYA